MGRDIQSISGTPTSYGRACMTCARAKCKCIFRDIDGSCERCCRLKKVCRPSATVRTRNPKGKVSKTAQLHQRLDGLVSLLQSTPAASDASSTATRGLENGRDVDRTTRAWPQFQVLGPVNGGFDPLAPIQDSSLFLTERACSEPTSYPSSMSITPCALSPSPPEAEQYLTDFRTQKSRYFPFVNIESTTSARQLLQHRPFLWLCIMAMSSKSTIQQRALGDKIRHTVAQKMLIESEKDLDLLLGLLAYIGWANYFVRDKPSLTVFTQLAISLVFDLGLNKPPQIDQHVLRIVSHAFTKSSHSNIQTMEGKRAVLGCFLISSTLSSYLKKIDALRWTPHMSECLQILEEAQECPNDEILVQQVRLQLIVEQVIQSHWQEYDIATTMPSSFHRNALQSQLQEVRRNMTPESQQNKILLLHLHTTALTISETAIPLFNLPYNYLDPCSLDTALASLKSWFDTFFTIELAEYTSFPFSIFTKLGHCFIALFRLSTLDDPAWDQGLVRDTIDVLAILDRVLENMRHASGLAGFDGDSDDGENVFTRGARIAGFIRRDWVAKLQTGIPTTNLTATGRQYVDGASPGVAGPMDSSDDSWMTDINIWYELLGG